MREQDNITVSRVERRNSAPSDAFKQRPIYTIGDWVGIYNTAAIIHQGDKSDTDAKVLTAKLLRNWTAARPPTPHRTTVFQPPSWVTRTSLTTCQALTPTVVCR